MDEKELSPRYLTEQHLTRRYHCCRASIRNRMRAGDLPAPVKFGRRSLWIVDELDACDARRDADQRAKAA
jgi:predicted DNA-binding transcriptional regulator AlpA